MNNIIKTKVCFIFKILTQNYAYLMPFNEITYELGFSDESHLNRAFKKYKGMNPSEFRKTDNLARLENL